MVTTSLARGFSMTIWQILICLLLTGVVAYLLSLAYSHIAKMPAVGSPPAPVSPWLIWLLQGIAVVVAIIVIAAIWGIGGHLDLDHRIVGSAATLISAG